MTGARRRYSTIHLPERLARTLGMSEEENVLRIEHHDEGLASSEIPFIHALWELKAEEEKNNQK